jgi:hypothetical protein
MKSVFSEVTQQVGILCHGKLIILPGFTLFSTYAILHAKVEVCPHSQERPYCIYVGCLHERRPPALHSNHNQSVHTIVTVCLSL